MGASLHIDGSEATVGDRTADGASEGLCGVSDGARDVEVAC